MKSIPSDHTKWVIVGARKRELPPAAGTEPSDRAPLPVSVRGDQLLRHLGALVEHIASEP